MFNGINTTVEVFEPGKIGLRVDAARKIVRGGMNAGCGSQF